jgi:hypothetical protein
MATKHAERHESKAESPIVYFLVALMWVIFGLALYLIWQKAAM